MDSRGLKARTIKAVIRKKLDSWLETIEDSEVREAARKDAVVTGGCIASMLLGEKVNDYDVYFRTKATTLAVARYYVDLFNGIHNSLVTVGETEDIRDEPRVLITAQSVGIKGEERPPEEAGDYSSEVMDSQEPEPDEQKDFRPIFLSSNAITLSGKIQIIVRFFGSPEALHENYDFVHCTNYYTSGNSDLVLRPKALQCLLSRTLVYQGSRYPICSMFRIRKFIARGWRINAGQMLKIAMQISKLDLTSFSVIEDQLTGVDIAYFEQMLRAMKGREGEPIDAAYLTEVIDRMFGE